MVPPATVKAVAGGPDLEDAHPTVPAKHPAQRTRLPVLDSKLISGAAGAAGSRAAPA